MFGETLAPVMLRDLLAFVRSWPPAVMIHDTMEFAAPIEGEAIGAVRVAHSYGPLTFEHRMLAIAAAVTPLWEAVSADPPHYGEIYDPMYLDIYPSSLQQTLGGHMRRRQPVRPVPYAPPGDQLLPALADDDRPLVYATLGTELPDHGALRTVVEAISVALVMPAPPRRPAAQRHRCRRRWYRAGPPGERSRSPHDQRDGHQTVSRDCVPRTGPRTPGRDHEDALTRRYRHSPSQARKRVVSSSRISHSEACDLPLLRPVAGEPRLPTDLEHSRATGRRAKRRACTATAIGVT